MKNYAILRDAIDEKVFGLVIENNGGYQFYGADQRSKEWATWANSTSIKSLVGALPVGVVAGQAKPLVHDSESFIEGLIESAANNSTPNRQTFSFKGSELTRAHSATPSARDFQLRSFDIQSRKNAVNFKALAFKNDQKTSSLLAKMRASNISFNEKTGEFKTRDISISQQAISYDIEQTYTKSLQRHVGLTVTAAKTINAKSQSPFYVHPNVIELKRLGGKIGSRIGRGLRSAPMGMVFVDVTGAVDADKDGIVFEGKPGLERPIIPKFILPESVGRRVASLISGQAENNEKNRRAGVSVGSAIDEGKLREILGNDASSLDSLTSQVGEVADMGMERPGMRSIAGNLRSRRDAIINRRTSADKLSRVGRGGKTQINTGDSRAVEKMSWDDDAKELVVTFAGGRTYTYKGVDDKWVSEIETNPDALGRIMNDIKKAGYDYEVGGEHAPDKTLASRIQGRREAAGMRSGRKPSRVEIATIQDGFDKQREDLLDDIERKRSAANFSGLELRKGPMDWDVESSSFSDGMGGTLRRWTSGETNLDYIYEEYREGGGPAKYTIRALDASNTGDGKPKFEGEFNSQLDAYEALRRVHRQNGGTDTQSSYVKYLQTFGEERAALDRAYRGDGMASRYKRELFGTTWNDRKPKNGIPTDLETGQVDFSEDDLSDIDLSGADLSGAELGGKYLSGAKLNDIDGSRIDLTDATLSEANLQRSDLVGAEMAGANLRQANLRKANLTDANLRGAYLEGADLVEAWLENADLREANLQNAKLNAWMPNADLRKANLRGADLRDGDLSGADLSDADLSDADLRGVNLDGAVLTGADLTNAKLDPGWEQSVGMRSSRRTDYGPDNTTDKARLYDYVAEITGYDEEFGSDRYVREVADIAHKRWRSASPQERENAMMANDHATAAALNMAYEDGLLEKFPFFNEVENDINREMERPDGGMSSRRADYAPDYISSRQYQQDLEKFLRKNPNKTERDYRRSKQFSDDFERYIPRWDDPRDRMTPEEQSIYDYEGWTPDEVEAGLPDLLESLFERGMSSKRSDLTPEGKASISEATQKLSAFAKESSFGDPYPGAEVFDKNNERHQLIYDMFEDADMPSQRVQDVLNAVQALGEVFGEDSDVGYTDRMTYALDYIAPTFDARLALSKGIGRGRNTGVESRRGDDAGFIEFAVRNDKLSSVGKDMTNLDLAGADMSNGDFSGMDFTGAKLTGANLTGAIFNGATMPDGQVYSPSIHDKKYKISPPRADGMDSRVGDKLKQAGRRAVDDLKRDAKKYAKTRGRKLIEDLTRDLLSDEPRDRRGVSSSRAMPGGVSKPGFSGRSRAATLERTAIGSNRGMQSAKKTAMYERHKIVPGQQKAAPNDGQLWASLSPADRELFARRAMARESQIIEMLGNEFELPITGTDRRLDDETLSAKEKAKIIAKTGGGKPWVVENPNAPGFYLLNTEGLDSVFYGEYSVTRKAKELADEARTYLDKGDLDKHKKAVDKLSRLLRLSDDLQTLAGARLQGESDDSLINKADSYDLAIDHLHPVSKMAIMNVSTEKPNNREGGKKKLPNVYELSDANKPFEFKFTNAHTRSKSTAIEVPGRPNGPKYDFLRQAGVRDEDGEIAEVKRPGRFAELLRQKFTDLSKADEKARQKRIEKLRKEGKNIGSAEFVEDDKDRKSLLDKNAMRQSRIARRKLLDARPRSVEKLTKAAADNNNSVVTMTAKTEDGKVLITPDGIAALATSLAPGEKEWRKHYSNKGGGGRGQGHALAFIWGITEMNGTPHAVNEEEFKQLLDAGWRPIKRGTGTREYGIEYMDAPKRYLVGKQGEAYGPGEYWSTGNNQSWGSSAYYPEPDGLKGDGPGGIAGLLPPTAKIVTASQLDTIRSDHRKFATELLAYFGGYPGNEWRNEDQDNFIAGLVDSVFKKIPRDSAAWDSPIGQMTLQLIQAMESNPSKEEFAQLREALFRLTAMVNQNNNIYAPLFGFDAIDVGSDVVLVMNRAAVTVFADPMHLNAVVSMGKGLGLPPGYVLPAKK